MAIFRGLSEIIREQIRINVPLEHTHPISTEEATLVGQNTGQFTNTSATPVTGVFRWGYSTWGVDTIIGVKLPSDL